MILKRRLLLGLTRRTENLWLFHLSASGPSGILASRRVEARVISVSYETEQDGEGHQDVGDDDHRRQRHGEIPSPLVEAGMVDPEALEHRPGAVEEKIGRASCRERV